MTFEKFLGDGAEVAPYKDRSSMLTVGKLMDYLKTCNPDACVVGYEINANAYTEQLPELPNVSICTVEEDKKREFERLNRLFGSDEYVVENQMEELYRYVKDDDIIVRF